MATTDKVITGPIVNILTTSQYQGITNPSADEFYLITDDSAIVAGTGLTATTSNGLTLLDHSNSITAQATQAVYPITIDAQGHITSVGTPFDAGTISVDTSSLIPKSIGTAAGDIIYWSGSGSPVRLAKGSDGQVLKLASGVPTWGTDNNNDTKNTAGSTDTSSKIFLVGLTTQTASGQSYSDNQVYATNGQLDANKVRVAENVTLQYNATTKSLDFIFA
jgi:hypothetical protein